VTKREAKKIGGERREEKKMYLKITRKNTREIPLFIFCNLRLYENI
jgi:hypothetical protein